MDSSACAAGASGLYGPAAGAWVSEHRQLFLRCCTDAACRPLDPQSGAGARQWAGSEYCPRSHREASSAGESRTAGGRQLIEHSVLGFVGCLEKRARIRSPIRLGLSGWQRHSRRRPRFGDVRRIASILLSRRHRLRVPPGPARPGQSRQEYIDAVARLRSAVSADWAFEHNVLLWSSPKIRGL